MQFAEHYLETVIKVFKSQKRLAEGAMEQLEPEAFHSLLDAEANSVALLIKHMSGNMRSRWQDFLTSDGEKADRNRDDEFLDHFTSLAEVMMVWERGWQVLFTALERLSPADLGKTVKIRGEDHSVIEAIERQVSHYAYHVGQIVFLAKHLKSDSWQTLSVPRGGSERFNLAKSKV